MSDIQRLAKILYDNPNDEDARKEMWRMLDREGAGSAQREEERVRLYYSLALDPEDNSAVRLAHLPVPGPWEVRDWGIEPVVLISGHPKWRVNINLHGYLKGNEAPREDAGAKLGRMVEKGERVRPLS